MDLLGRRWALRLIWELRAGPVRARALLAQCDGLSSSVLYERLGDLSAAGLIVSTSDGYQLTAIGSSLGTALKPLDLWAETWNKALQTPAGDS